MILIIIDWVDTDPKYVLLMFHVITTIGICFLLKYYSGMETRKQVVAGLVYVFNPIILFGTLICMNTSIISNAFFLYGYGLMKVVEKNEINEDAIVAVTSAGFLCLTVSLLIDPLMIVTLPSIFLFIYRSFNGLSVVRLCGCVLSGIALIISQMKITIFNELLEANLTPNAGFVWYSEAQAFPEFSQLFHGIYGLHPFVYIVPLVSLQFLNSGLDLDVFILLLMIISIWRPQPDLLQILFAFAVHFIQLPGLIAKIEHVRLYFLAMMVAATLMPIMVYLWLIRGSGNANFLFFQNLVFIAAASQYISQLVCAIIPG